MKKSLKTLVVVTVLGLSLSQAHAAQDDSAVLTPTRIAASTVDQIYSMQIEANESLVHIQRLYDIVGAEGSKEEVQKFASFENQALAETEKIQDQVLAMKKETDGDVLELRFKEIQNSAKIIKDLDKEATEYAK